MHQTWDVPLLRLLGDIDCGGTVQLTLVLQYMSPSKGIPCATQAEGMDFLCKHATLSLHHPPSLFVVIIRAQLTDKVPTLGRRRVRKLLL